MAMLTQLDQGVGRIVETLKSESVWDNTLLFFLTDNGGSNAMSADNTPLRGFKQQNYEGGIRTPFIVSWPARFPGGRTLDAPVISLDILPTALAAADITPHAGMEFDGRNLLPLLSGETDTVHDALFWSEGGSTGEWAVRAGDWKLVASREQRELYNLADDPSETSNVASDHPDHVQRLNALYDTWLDEMADPIAKGVSKRWGTTESPELTPELTPREQQRLQKRMEKLKAKGKAPTS